MPPCVRNGFMWLGWSRNQMRSHSSRNERRSSDVKINSWARRAGSAEYIGMRQPVPLESQAAAKNAMSALRIPTTPAEHSIPHSARTTSRRTKQPLVALPIAAEGSPQLNRRVRQLVSLHCAISEAVASTDRHVPCDCAQII